MTKALANTKRTAYGTEYLREKPTRILTESGEYIHGDILVAFDPMSRTYSVRFASTRTITADGSLAGRMEYPLLSRITKQNVDHLLDMTTETDAAPEIALLVRQVIPRANLFDALRMRYGNPVGKRFSITQLKQEGILH